MEDNLSLEGCAMDPDAEVETSPQTQQCPECGSEENGFFCGSCGLLLRGEEMVLCPRCHQVVPSGDYCNQCGQGLGAIALQLQQLAKAGDEFWVTSGGGEISSLEESALLEPDETLDLADAEPPDWLQELPAEDVPPEVGPRIYPALQPIEQEQTSSRRNAFFTVVILLMFLLLVGIIVMALFVLLGNLG
jgi:hypothetical protein